MEDKSAKIKQKLTISDGHSSCLALITAQLDKRDVSRQISNVV